MDQHSHPSSPIPLRSMVVAAASARCCSVVTPILHHSRPAAASASALRLPRRITRPPLSCSTSASPLVTVASMDAPPQGYRTNVGICLANPSLTKASSHPLKPDPSFSSARCPVPSYFRVPWSSCHACVLLVSRFSRLLGLTFLARGRCLRVV
ncbi:hypothetical protein PVAP13_7KG366200 [Panicum virgatum]|uniref:Uncharacterized protein n=1 Tax=Panicum virgatum TaxID=38727 RepID=A0A8T0QRW7_PANVG|nr:hypothetical protein PVAP13_7KG366200 [Panicum virgatum]